MIARWGVDAGCSLAAERFLLGGMAHCVYTIDSNGGAMGRARTRAGMLPVLIWLMPEVVRMIDEKAKREGVTRQLVVAKMLARAYGRGLRSQ
jgi:hypothetical protein